MYRWKMLRLAPPAKAGGGGGGDQADETARARPAVENHTGLHADAGRFVEGGADLSSPPTVPPAPAAVLVAFKPDEPVLKVLRPAGGRWAECRWADGDSECCTFDVLAFGGRLYVITTHGWMAVVEFTGGGGVKMFYQESDRETFEEEGEATVVRYIFDVDEVDEETEGHAVTVFTDPSGINEVVIHW